MELQRGNPQDVACPDIVSEIDARRELSRLLSDTKFHCTERNRKFLRFVAEEYFHGRENQVKAYTIAVDVFGRPAAFDPSADPIVRIEATRLRAALASYYETHGDGRSVHIELPKGHYVPIFWRCAGLAAPSCEPASQPPLRQEWWLETLSRLFPNLASRWMSACLGLAGGILIGFVVFSQSWSPEFSEKPRLTIELKMSDGSADRDAVAVRDALMVALSGFQAARVSAPGSFTASTGFVGTAPAPAGLQSSYRLLLRYDAGSGRSMLWWQIIDEATGEALRSGTERADSWRGEQPKEQLAFQLAVRLASSRGIINTIESTREFEHPTLGNGCVLRAIVAVDANDKDALVHAQSCLEETLRLRSNNADAHALLAAVLLKRDPVDAPTALTQEAALHAGRAVALAPDSDRSYYALMTTEFRVGNVDAAIAAGRRSLDLNPNNPLTMGKLAHILFVTGRWDEGAELARTARTQVVDSRDAQATLAFDAYRRGQFEETLLLLNQINRPECYCLQVLRVATLARLGRFDEANTTIAALRASRPRFEASLRADLVRRRFAPDLVGLLETGLVKAGLKVA